MTKTQVSGLSTVVLLLLMILFSYPAPMFAADDFDSLRAEIAAANRSSSGAITLSGDIVLSAALPQITGRVTIEGAGHTISGAGEYRIFDVAGGRLALSNVTLTDGRAAQGGAIRMRNGAQVTIENSTLSANSARHGGAIATSNGSDRLNISDSDFIGNIAEQSAGAIYANGGVVNITGGSFVKNCAQFAFFSSGNYINEVRRSVDDDGCHRVTYFGSEITAEVQSRVDGGAIRLRHGARVSVEGSSFSENSATYGGAISSASKNIRLTVNNSSFVSNRASWNGGAIGAIWAGGGSISVNSSSFVKNRTDDGDGGAIEAGQGAFDISNSTFSENYSDFGGGGAINVAENGAASITHATFVENRSRGSGEAIRNTGGELYLRNSIIVTSGSGDNCVGVWEHAGNLSPDGSCADRPSDDPLLGDITGSPAYYPLRDRSPAIDYADPKYCLETDQLGRPRPQGGGCDIGAIEARGAIAAEPTPVPPLVCSLAFQIVAANRDQPASGCPAGSGVDTIVLDKDITLFEPLPSIASQIVIEGNGHSISGEGKFRIFDVDGGILTVKNLTMRDGYRRVDNGGAIRLLNDGRATVSDSRFINNRADNGGAVFIGWAGTDRSSLTVNNSSFVGNRSLIEGGAIFAHGGTVSVRNSSFVNNSAGSDGSAIKIASTDTRLDVVNSSFIRNQRSVVFVESGATATLTHVTIFGVSAAFDTYEGESSSPFKLSLRNSIVIGKFDSVICDSLKQNIGNFIGDDACSPRLSGDPMLEEATDSAAYLEPLPGSPAIGAADLRYCPDTDQLGRARSFVGRCDIGAIESIPVRETLSDCTVTTTHTLNFREQPDGTRFGTVAENATVTATARTAGWFQVEYRGATGWISADYVVAQGVCG